MQINWRSELTTIIIEYRICVFVCVVYDSFRVDKVAVSNALSGPKRHVVTLVSGGSVFTTPCICIYI